MRRTQSLLCLVLLPLLSACNKTDTTGLEARLGAAEAQIAALKAAYEAHAADAVIHHAKTTSFSELGGTISDAQVPDDITVAFAQTAGDADTLDGYHAHEIAESGTFTPSVSGLAFGWAPEGAFSYLRTGNRVRVTGSLQDAGLINLVFDWIDVANLPYRLTPFSSPTDVIGVGSADLTEFGSPNPVGCSLDAVVGLPRVRVSFTPLGSIVYNQGTVSVDFSYDVDP